MRWVYDALEVAGAVVVAASVAAIAGLPAGGLVLGAYMVAAAIAGRVRQ